MPQINFGDLPKGIDFYDPNWANNYDVNQVFPGQGGGIVAVNDGHGHFLNLPIGFVQNQDSRYGSHPFANNNSAASSVYNMLFGSGQSHAPVQGQGLSTTEGNAPGNFADYLAQIGVHVPGSTGVPASNPDSVGAIMAGFGSPGIAGQGWVGALRGRFGAGANGGGLQNYYNSFLHYANQHPVAGAAPIPAQTQAGMYQF